MYSLALYTILLETLLIMMPLLMGKRTMYLEMYRRLKEEAHAKAERKAMAREDELSRIPPKTKGPIPRVRILRFEDMIVPSNSYSYLSPIRDILTVHSFLVLHIHTRLNLFNGLSNLYSTIFFAL